MPNSCRVGAICATGPHMLQATQTHGTGRAPLGPNCLDTSTATEGCGNLSFFLNLCTRCMRVVCCPPACLPFHPWPTAQTVTEALANPV